MSVANVSCRGCWGTESLSNEGEQRVERRVMGGWDGVMMHTDTGKDSLHSFTVIAQPCCLCSERHTTSFCSCCFADDDMHLVLPNCSFCLIELLFVKVGRENGVIWAVFVNM